MRRKVMVGRAREMHQDMIIQYQHQAIHFFATSSSWRGGVNKLWGTQVVGRRPCNNHRGRQASTLSFAHAVMKRDISIGICRT